MIKNIITFVILYAVHAANSIADDIEIYQNGDFGVRPNVMFLLDTSGSMEETVELYKGEYRSDRVYPGPFHTDRYYFREFSIGGDWFNLDLDNEAYRNAMLGRYIHEDAFRCQSLKGNLDRYGKLDGGASFLQWNPNKDYRNWAYIRKSSKKGVWTELNTTLDPNRYVECQNDIQTNRGGASSYDNKFPTHEGNRSAYTTNINDAIESSITLYKGYWGCALGVCPQATESIYTGNYLNYDYYTGSDEITEASRMYIMGAAIAEAIGSTPGLNVGLARFEGSLLLGNPGQGGMISIPMSRSEDSAQQFESTIKNWDPYGWTPMSESYYEVARYMRGDSPKYGLHTFSRLLSGGLLSSIIPEHRPSVDESFVNDNPSNDYESPITESCQSNHIIVFTDGAPTRDNDAENDIQTLISSTSLPAGLDSDCSGHGECADELAYFLANEDQINDNKVEGIQSITTHTVGGFISSDQASTTDRILKNMADYGEGTYSSINSYDEMRRAFKNILGGVLQEPVSFTAPVVSVNAFNSLELSDELYYSVFEPKNNLSWSGNLKRYRLGTLEVDGDNVPAILDAKDINAIDPKTTFFDVNAQSYWAAENDAPDGEMVTRGGMANRLTIPRNIFTSEAGSSALVSLDTVSINQLNIADKIASDPDYTRKLIAWANGYDTTLPEDDGSFSTVRKKIEDPLHSEPTIIKYSSSVSSTGEKSADRTLFIGTNSGYVHAFDVDEDEPKEHFSFIPKELLQNLDKYYSGGTLYEHKAYGIDGPLTHWHQDSNGNGQVDNDEQVYLYITMRRGGQSLYALNVTDRTEPTLEWEKHGNYPADFPNKPAVSPDYEQLGQTWARMEPATVMWNNEQRVVLFTAGGYDPIEDGTDNDGPSTRAAHTQGATVYMIDALNGEVLWDASKHAVMKTGMEMTSSIASNVAPIDTTGDGLANMLYASDVGGRVWRFDINQPRIDGNLPNDFETVEFDFANGSAILDVSSGPSGGNRRFFNEVDVIYQKSKNAYEDSVLLSIGSGMRPHPLSTVVTNYHFVIKDILQAPETENDYHTITFDQLSEYGSDNIYGWYVSLNTPGEKVLSRSNTFSNSILFSTFSPHDLSTTTVNCNAEAGVTKLYILNDGKVSAIETKSGGIPPSPTIIELPAEKDDTGIKKERRKRNIIVGTEIVTEMDENGKESAKEVGSEFDGTTKDYWLEMANSEMEEDDKQESAEE